MSLKGRNSVMFWDMLFVIIVFCITLMPIVVPFLSGFSYFKKLSEYRRAKREDDKFLYRKRNSLIWTAIVFYSSIIILIVGFFSVVVFDGRMSFM